MNRRLRSLDTVIWVGENKIVIFDPRISLDDQNKKPKSYKIDQVKYLIEIQGKP